MEREPVEHDRVEHERVGHEHHDEVVVERDTVEHRHRHYSAGSGIGAGLIAGVVFIVMEMLLVAIAGGGSLWGPPRMIGAIVLGQDALPPPPTFDAVIVIVGLIVHFVLAAILGAIFALLLGRFLRSTGAAILIGALFGLVVYLVNFYGFTAIFPWFEMARNWITVLSHIVFGAVLGWYLARRYVTTTRTTTTTTHR